VFYVYIKFAGHLLDPGRIMLRFISRKHSLNLVVILWKGVINHGTRNPDTSVLRPVKGFFFIFSVFTLPK